ncbi:MAG TPA: GIY-YIG nuclease family protein [Chitinophagaceae bacterium]|nr:GIY-YIG nuclease family protein [Chitinophagaceae bacterium]
MPFYVYILYSATTNRYYIGSCEEVETRLQQHNSGRNLSTKYGIPWELKKMEVFITRSEAFQSESFIKKMKSKAFIEKVIAGKR